MSTEPTPNLRPATIAGLASANSATSNEENHQQQPPSSGFPAMARESGVSQAERTNIQGREDDECHPSNNNKDVGDQQPDTNQRYDETASQVADTRASTTTQHCSSALVRRQREGNQEQLPSAPSSTPYSAIVPVEFPVRPGAYAIDGFNAGNAGRQSSAASATGSMEQEPPPPSEDAPQDRTVIADAVTTDDLEDRLRSRILEEVQAGTVTAEVVVSAKKPFWKRRSFLVVLGVLSLAAVGGMIGGIVASRSNGGSPSTLSPTSAPLDNVSRPTMAPTGDPVIIATADLVKQNSFDGGMALKNSSSPQYKALNWLLFNNTFLHEYSNQTKLQRYALATLYYSTNGTGWTRSYDWMSDRHECIWYSGSRVACSDGELISTLDLHSENLVGTLPSELALLSASLATIGLEGNRLSGSIPTEFGFLTKLELLRLDRNDLSSTIPSQIGVMSSLERVELHQNNLGGSISTRIGQLLNLEQLYLYSNNLTGSLPSEIGRATSLETLILYDNNLTGTIPSEINKLTNLNSLRLYDNNFTPPFTCPSFLLRCYISCSNSGSIGSPCREL